MVFELKFEFVCLKILTGVIPWY